MKKHVLSVAWFWLRSALLLTAFVGISYANRAPHAFAATTLTVYGDALAQGWENWSWDTTVNFAATNPVHNGSHAIAVTHNAGFAGFSLRTATPINTSGYSALAFWIYGNGAPLSVYVQTTDETDPVATHDFTPTAGQWAEVTIPLSELGAPAQIARLNWQSQSDDAQGVYYLDDIRLIGTTQEPPPQAGITLQVDVAAARKPISPYIYGMNEYGTEDDAATLIAELRLPVRRWGGNATSRYNYLNDISNHASDWYFNNRKWSNATNMPDDSAVNRFIDTNRAGNADSLVVLPLSGYVANNDGEACGFRVSKYGAQEDTAAADGRPDCGNGKKPDGSLITGNDPHDTSIDIDPTFVGNWVTYLVGHYGRANAGGVRFFNYDNEPDIWFETHRDIKPIGYKYDEIRDLTYQYGAAVKAADPAAQLLGPTVNGWTYYWYSAYDGQREDWETPDDRNAHGGTPFIPWYLQQMKAYEDQNDVRILDYLDLHYYPQANGVSLAEAGSAATQALRLRSTRSLWDPTYVDESWIKDAGPDGGVVRLIPRMHEWIDANYPGTKLAIGEYNWGGLEDINGALTQADVLGIFGREGMGFATLWQPPRLTQPGAFAFRIYRNYDKAGSQFGDTSVSATSSDQGTVSIYAAQRSSDKALTIVIINKSGAAQAATLTLANFTPGGDAQLYRYSAADLNAIVHGADVTITNGAIAASYPANSITLLVIPQDKVTQPPAPEFHSWLPLMTR